MKKTFTHIRFSRKLLGVCAVALVLCACEWDNNFFYHPVEFRGEAEEPQLVVNALLEADSTPVIYVNRSVFFLDSTAYGMVEHNDIYAGEDTFYTYVTNDLRRDYVKDAVVEMRIDDGPWTKLTCVQLPEPIRDSYSAAEYRSYAWAYVSDVVLRPGNAVEVRIAHKDYPEGASVRTVLPVRAGALVEEPDLSVERKPALVPLKITLPPYTGNPTDVLCIRSRTYASTKDTTHLFTGLDPVTGDSLWDHSTSLNQQNQMWPQIYSRDIGFASYDLINQSLSQNYFGSHIGLYHDVNLTDAPITLEVEVPYYPEFYRRTTYLQDRQLYYTSLSRTDSIVIDVLTVNRDAYFYLSSMMQAGHVRNEVFDAWADIDEDFDFSDLFNEIQDAFSEMGSMEGIQIYGNAEGAFGQMGARTAEHFVLTGK